MFVSKEVGRRALLNFATGAAIAGVSRLFSADSGRAEMQRSCVRDAIRETSHTNDRGETITTTQLALGDVLVLSGNKLKIGENLYDMTSQGGLIVVAIGAQTAVDNIAYTTYRWVYTGRDRFQSSAPDEDKRENDIIEIAFDQARTRQLPGQGCTGGCQSIRVVVLEARETRFQNGMRSPNLRVIVDQMSVR